ncbi:MAG: ATPase, T2SS/T4P/T4SS family, partial [Phycisphaeraceae bacterium]
GRGEEGRGDLANDADLIQRVEGAAGLGRHRLELETAGSTRGMMLRLRIDRRQRLRVKFGELGLTESQAEQLREVVGELEGVVLIAAPSGQGSSTTMYSLVNEHDPYTTSVVTLEEQVPIELEGVSHNELPAGASPQEANEKLASLLRQDPNVMMLPQLKDAQMARQIAESGREMRVYSNLPANDTFDALRKWVKLVGDRRSAGKPLRAIVSQRLMRRLCPTCRTSYRPDPAVLKKLNLPADRVSQLYQASGQVVIKDKPQPCPACHGLAYRGRVGVFEVMVLDDPARNLLQQGDVERLKTHLRKQRMTWLQEAALSKVVDGVTDIKEVTRVLGGGKPGSGRVQEAKEPVA